MESLFREMPKKAENSPPDNRVYLAFFFALRMIKIQVKLNNIKHSQNLMKWIDV